MKKYVLGCLMAAGFVLAGVTLATAGPVNSIDMRDAAVAGGTVQYVEWGYCDRMRRACIRGYEPGACANYREECRRPGGYESDEGRYRSERRYNPEPRYNSHQRRCSQLRFACREKERIGEEGQGNCRRYHNECGGY